MEFVLAAPPVDTLETSQQMSGEGANLSGPFDSSTPEPSPRRVGTVGASIQPLPSFAPPRRVGTTAATHKPLPTFPPSANSTPGPSPKRHVPCALPPTRSVSPAPVDPAPVLPPGESRDGAGPSGSSAAASVKKKKPLPCTWFARFYIYVRLAPRTGRRALCRPSPGPAACSWPAQA